MNNCNKTQPGTRFTLLLLIFVGLFSILLGCTSISVKGTDSPKGPVGFIEFYYPEKYHDLGLRPEIYSIKNYRSHYEGSIDSFDSSGYGEFRIPRPPGEYDFAVTLGSAYTEIRKIRVVENQLTPIRIQVNNIKTGFVAQPALNTYSSFSISRQTKFQMKLIMEGAFAINDN